MAYQSDQQFGVRFLIRIHANAIGSSSSDIKLTRSTFLPFPPVPGISYNLMSDDYIPGTEVEEIIFDKGWERFDIHLIGPRERGREDAMALAESEYIPHGWEVEA